MRISDWSSDVCSSDLKGNRKMAHGYPGTVVATPHRSARCPSLPRTPTPRNVSRKQNILALCSDDNGPLVARRHTHPPRPKSPRSPANTAGPEPQHQTPRRVTPQRDGGGEGE